MFTAEAKGLQLLKSSDSFRIPEVFATNIMENTSYLMMEYVATGLPKLNYWEIFGQNLAALHKITKDNFGLDHDNYIGRLPQ